MVVDARPGAQAVVPDGIFQSFKQEMSAAFANDSLAPQVLLEVGLTLFEEGTIAAANQFFELALLGLVSDATEQKLLELSRLTQKDLAAQQQRQILPHPRRRGVTLRKPR